MNAQCNHCTLQSPIPHHPRPANFPTSRQVEKPTSWQVGKHRHLPLHHQPVPAAPLFSLTPPVNHRPPLVSRLNPPTLHPCCARRILFSYPGVNQPHLCYTTHQRETPALRSPPPDPPARSPPLPSLLAPAGNGDSTMQSQHSAITAQRNHPPRLYPAAATGEQHHRLARPRHPNPIPFSYPGVNQKPAALLPTSATRDHPHP